MKKQTKAQLEQELKMYKNMEPEYQSYWPLFIGWVVTIGAVLFLCVQAVKAYPERPPASFEACNVYLDERAVNRCEELGGVALVGYSGDLHDCLGI